MDYTLDQYAAVREEVERQGGVQLEERHMRRDVVFRSPPYAVDRCDKKFSCGCGNNTVFVAEYNGEEGRVGLVKACAVCDHLGAWPRFMHSFIDAGGEL